MARSVYFSQGVRSEQNLYEDLVIEALRTYGQDCMYLPRGKVTQDMILNELIESSFSDAYMMEMYLENVDGFEGDGAFLSKFGLEIRTQATFVVARKTWNKMVGAFETGLINTRPAEGDLIYLPLTKSLFEIKFVEHKQPFYQLTNLPIYKLQCELFEASNERIDTGVPELDNISLDYATETVMDITGGATGFTTGEDVFQYLTQPASGVTAAEIRGRVLRQIKTSATTWRIYIGNISNTAGMFTKIRVSTGGWDKLHGRASGAAWTITKVYEIDDPAIDHTFEYNNQQAQNREFELKSDAMLSFDEKNPFGDPSTV